MSGLEVATKVTHGLKPTLPTTLNPELSQLLLQCLETQPEKRPHFETLMNQLEEIQRLYES